VYTAAPSILLEDEPRSASLEDGRDPLEMKALFEEDRRYVRGQKKPPEKGGKPGVTKVYKYLVRKRSSTEGSI
jgi:hypothetical protein